MSEIISKLPTALQIECIKYLVTPNERIILLGINGVGKKSFIRKCNNFDFQSEYSINFDSVEFIKFNKRVKIAVLSGLWSYTLEFRLLKFVKQPPTRVILMASVISSLSLRKIYLYYIPLFLGLRNEMKDKPDFKIDIILTNTDHPRYTWKELELRILKRKLKEFDINSMYLISNKTGNGFDNKYFDCICNEF